MTPSSTRSLSHSVCPHETFLNKKSESSEIETLKHRNSNLTLKPLKLNDILYLDALGPESFYSELHLHFVNDVLSVCCSVLQVNLLFPQVLTDVLIPATMQEMPERFVS